MRKYTKKILIVLCLSLLIGMLSGFRYSSSPDAKDAMPGGTSEPEATVDNEVVQAILDSYSAKSFVEGAVSDDDLQLILQSGAKAPSSRNTQPWYFTVVTGDKASELIREAPDGSVLIIISGLDVTSEDMLVDYDCGLASAYMYLAAQALGYGAHIYKYGVSDINETQREELEIPDGYNAVMMMLIGNVQEDVDAVSSATTRNPLDETVTYLD